MKVCEIFTTLQGEGLMTGVPSVFVRLAGCNLRCPFCDTDFADGEEMPEAEIVKQVLAYPIPHVVITGGEPTLQLNRSLLQPLHDAGRTIQIETNGTVDLPDEMLGLIDHVTCSPKAGSKVRLRRIDELKVVYTGMDDARYAEIEQLAALHGDIPCLMQPCDTGRADENARLLAETMDWVMAHPAWRLSLQTHKMLNIR